MAKTTWYFDFISPFAYLQLERLAKETDLTQINLRPIVFGALLQHLGNRGPAEITEKRTFTYRIAQWTADEAGIAFKMPPAHPFNPIKFLRLAIALNNEPEKVQAIFRFIWRDGGDVTSEAAWATLCDELAVEDADELISQQTVKDQLRLNTQEACEKGLFGVPSLVVGKDIFWGNDATEMYLDYQANPALFESEEYKRISELPMAISRV